MARVLLQADFSKAEARVEQIKQRQAVLDDVATKSAEIKIKQQQLYLRFQRDLQENDEVLRDAILAFEEASEALYEDAGNLNIYASEIGPRFEVTIRGQKSRGVQQMQVFCFDMMLIQLASQRNIGPGFLIHDSHIFDPVDERQVEKALEYAASLSEKLGFQYIVTMNTDQFPHERVTDFPLENYIVDVSLSDETETGGLFGFRF